MMIETKEALTRSRLHQSDRNVVLDEATRNRRQRKALEALEKDNYQENLPSLSTYVSEHRIQLNKKFQQKFTISDDQFQGNTASADSRDQASAASAPSTSSLYSTATAGTAASSVIGSTSSGPSGLADAVCVDQGNKRKRVKAESKLRFRKNFATLLEEEREAATNKEFSYFSICVPESKFPQRKFCSVCGCIQCGSKYCTTRCQQTHKDTRCLKWTA